MKRKFLLTVVVSFGALLILGLADWWCWANRETWQMRDAARVEASAKIRDLPSGDLAPYLLKLENEKHFAIRFRGGIVPYFGNVMAVDLGDLAAFYEDVVLRFSKPEDPSPEEAKGLRAVLDQMGGFMERHRGDEAVDSLSMRRMDGYFILRDYERAARAMEAGVPGRSTNWVAGTGAKLRAHAALDAGDLPRAIDHFLAFTHFMESDEMASFEDSDPSNGVCYNREWVVGRNYFRLAEIAKKANDARVEEFRRLGEKGLKAGREKIKADGDEEALELIEGEMKRNGVTP